MFDIHNDSIRALLFSGWHGCSNHDCVVKGKTSGMHTNGSCSCVQGASRSQLNILASRLKMLCSAIEKMQDEQDDRPPSWWQEFFRITAEHDIYEDVFWSTKGNFEIICNDTFHWGGADAEAVTEDDLPLLEQSLKETTGRPFGEILYCARKRGMRPQGAIYKYIARDLWPLFDAAGPERDPAEPGNTPKPEET